MTLDKEKTVFGSRHAKKLNIGDLVYWIEWIRDKTGKVDSNGAESLSSRQAKRFGVISELYVDERVERRVAMAKVVPMNSKDDKRVHEKSLIAISIKLVSSGGWSDDKKNNRVISE